MEFDWDEHNLFHIAMHGITRENVETALKGRTIFIKDEVRHGESRRSVLGRTYSASILMVITTSREGKTRCVTAFPANRYFRGLYSAKWPGVNHEQTQDAGF